MLKRSSRDGSKSGTAMIRPSHFPRFFQCIVWKHDFSKVVLICCTSVVVISSLSCLDAHSTGMSWSVSNRSLVTYRCPPQPFLPHESTSPWVQTNTIVTARDEWVIGSHIRTLRCFHTLDFPRLVMTNFYTYSLYCRPRLHHPCHPSVLIFMRYCMP